MASAPAVRHRAAFIAVLCGVQLLFTSSMTVVTVSLPHIQADLGMAQENIQWAITGYGLTFGGLLLVGGRAADYFGRRRILLVGLSLFTLGGLACLLAESGYMLVGGRATQGLGAALASPAAMSTLTGSFTDVRDKSRALASIFHVSCPDTVSESTEVPVL